MGKGNFMTKKEIEIDLVKTREKSEELFNKVDKLTSEFIENIPDEIRVDIAILDASISWLLKAFEITLDASINPNLRNKAIDSFKKTINDSLDALKDKKMH